MSAEKVISNARSCLGVKFRHMGRDPVRHLDCAGLLIYAFGEAGYETFDLATYSRKPSPMLMRQSILKVCVDVTADHLQPADIIYFRFRDPMHLGLYEGGNWLIHSYMQMRRVVEHEMNLDWHDRIVSVYRHRSLV